MNKNHVIRCVAASELIFKVIIHCLISDTCCGGIEISTANARTGQGSGLTSYGYRIYNNSYRIGIQTNFSRKIHGNSGHEILNRYLKYLCNSAIICYRNVVSSCTQIDSRLSDLSLRIVP
ncbi:hypothetical protein D3C85_1342700 [compost metagenome]